ncbi:hypothetical protein [Sphingomonas sp.]|uniref:hypothetical protein n=1 Tax=Sphingomonas sp. TaxID=28214 RepID=UPI002E2F26BA|nr:hypothetical protein [Sphingomonas sp.]HEX4693559.1 hypothetical protein [Sphingomonas sp.]
MSLVRRLGVIAAILAGIVVVLLLVFTITGWTFLLRQKSIKTGDQRMLVCEYFMAHQLINVTNQASDAKCPVVTKIER